MIFKKRKMVDLAELQKKGLILNNKMELPPTNRQGFIDMSAKEKQKIKEESTMSTQESPSSVFGFMDSFSSPSSFSPQSNSFSTESDGYSKREVDRRLEQMDNKLYKLEQRIELLERKNNISPY